MPMCWFIFLASTGLMKNRKCAVHWAAKNEFKTMFPDVKLLTIQLLQTKKEFTLVVADIHI